MVQWLVVQLNILEQRSDQIRVFGVKLLSGAKIS